MAIDSNQEKISKLDCWQGEPEIEVLSGGITNQNFKVTDNAGQFDVRLGTDII